MSRLLIHNPHKFDFCIAREFRPVVACGFGSLHRCLCTICVVCRPAYVLFPSVRWVHVVCSSSKGVQKDDMGGNFGLVTLMVMPAAEVDCAVLSY